MKSTITSSIKQGPRPYQEDCILHIGISCNSSHCGELLAVMDGHVGKSVAELCKYSIENTFQLSEPSQAESALRDLVRTLNTLTNHYDEGSTFSSALILNNPPKVSVVILGDSPVVVLDNHHKLHISPEHNVRSNVHERKAAQQRGGIYDNGYIYSPNGERGLQMSRSLGDAYLNGIISREPDVYSIDEPVWVLVASDGLLDPAHSNTVKLLEELEQYAQQNATAEELMKWAEKKGLKDNASALVWRLR